MGKCAFCGQDVGFLRSAHRECKNAHDAAKREIVELIVRQGLNYGDHKYLVKEINKLASSSYIHPRMVRDLLVEGWEKVVEATLNQPVHNEGALAELYRLAARLGIPESIVDNSKAIDHIARARDKIKKRLLLENLYSGYIPNEFEYLGHLPFNLQPAETLVWLFEDVHCAEWTETYPALIDGWGKLHDAKYDWLSIGYGLLGITSEHIYFVAFEGGSAILRFSYFDIVAFEPIQNGVGLRFAPYSYMPIRFFTGDGNFTYDLVSALSQMR